MKKSRINAPYLQVVHGNTTPDFTPPCPPGVAETAWQVLWHGDDLLDGHYDWFVAHGGPFVSDAALKAQGKIPADWDLTKESRLFPPVAAPANGGDSNGP